MFVGSWRWSAAYLLFSCVCAAGFDSKHKHGAQDSVSNETKCDDAGSCSNGGICHDATCFCAPGYGGQNCNTLTCPQGCSSHGYCRQGMCICQIGWSGHDCATPECFQNCSQRGICRVNNGTATCFCEQSWKGSYCQLRTCGFDANNLECDGRGHCFNGTCFYPSNASASGAAVQTASADGLLVANGKVGPSTIPGGMVGQNKSVVTSSSKNQLSNPVFHPPPTALRPNIEKPATVTPSDRTNTTAAKFPSSLQRPATEPSSVVQPEHASSGMHGDTNPSDKIPDVSTESMKPASPSHTKSGDDISSSAPKSVDNLSAAKVVSQPPATGQSAACQSDEQCPLKQLCKKGVCLDHNCHGGCRHLEYDGICVDNECVCAPGRAGNDCSQEAPETATPERRKSWCEQHFCPGSCQNVESSRIAQCRASCEEHCEIVHVQKFLLMSAATRQQALADDQVRFHWCRWHPSPSFLII